MEGLFFTIVAVEVRVDHGAADWRRPRGAGDDAARGAVVVGLRALGCFHPAGLARVIEAPRGAVSLRLRVRLLVGAPGAGDKAPPIIRRRGCLGEQVPTIRGWVFVRESPGEEDQIT